MKNFKENFYKTLINKENFYIKQYHSNLYDEEVFFAIKELREGIYCVLITNEERRDSDYLEAFVYINTLGKPFSLNIVILADEEYSYGEGAETVDKLIINSDNYEIIHCDPGCIPLKELFENNYKKRNIKDSFFKDKILTLAIIAINIIVFIVMQYKIYNSGNTVNEILINLGAKYNPLIENGEVWRLLTCAFLHSGFIHIGCNMYSLYIIGPQINQIYGWYKYLIIYTISCITSSLLSFYMSPYGISVGASGGIFGLMGALLAFAVIERHRIEKRYLSSLLQIIIINLFIGLNIRNIDNFGHIGGLLGGISIGYIIYKISQNKKEA